MSSTDCLANIPGSSDPSVIGFWAEMTGELVNRTGFDSEVRASFASLDGQQAAESGSDHLSRLANAALVADWACYAAAADRVDVPRLHSVVAAFPRGFRVWFCRFAAGYLPVGYTGWYPIKAEAFAAAYDRPGLLTHRGALRPVTLAPQQAAYLWLFNFSIVTGLRRSAESRKFLQAYAADLTGVEVKGLAAAVLSKESKAVVGRFGMRLRGQMTHDGVSEDVYAVRY